MVAVTSELQANFDNTKVLSVSATAQTIKIGLGRLDGVKIGERAEFYVPVERSGQAIFKQGSVNPVMATKNLKLAIGEAVKVNRSISYWSIRRVSGKGKFRGNLREGLPLHVMRLERDKRRPFVTRQTVKVSGRKKDQVIYEATKEEGVPNDLIFEDDDFESKDSVGDTVLVKKQDIEVDVRKTWVGGTDEYDEDFSDVYGTKIAPPIGNRDFATPTKKRIKEEIWRKASAGTINKYNKLKYGLNSLYKGNVRDSGTNTRLDRGELDFRPRETKETIDKVAVKQAISRIRKNPYRWSQDLTDKELRRFMIDASIVEEISRQKKALRNNFSNEVILRYATPMTNSSLRTDVNNQGLGYGLSIAYEFALGRVSESYRYFSVEAELETVLSFHDIGGDNGRFEERVGKLFANWYLINPPSSVKKFMPFLSAGIERGAASMEQGSLTGSLSYDLSTLLSTRFGIKYRFSSGDEKYNNVKVGYGMHFMVSYDSTRYTLSSSANTTAQLFNEFNANQTRVSTGLNIYF